MSKGRSLFGRIALGVVFGFLVLHLAGFYFYGHERMVQNASTYAISVAERAYALDKLLAEQPDLARYLSDADFNLARVDSVPVSELRAWPHSEEISSAVRTHLYGLGLPDAQSMRMWFLGRGGAQLVMYLPSAQSGFLKVTAASQFPRSGYGSPVGFVMSLVMLLLIVIVLWITRRYTRQLARFVVAAEQIGEGRRAEELPENVGSGELRRASAAFNKMQSRVQDLLAARTSMLAGVSHDLRTLCTRFGLRLEYISDPDQRERAERDIQTMTEILDQSLTFARDEQNEEQIQLLDLKSLLSQIVDDYADAGANAEFTATDEQVDIRAQPVATQRLFKNLIDNAVLYGGSVAVRLSKQGVAITDPGEGFAPAQQAHALKPYTRLDPGRSQTQPGSGLGLSIADNIIRRHGWALRFEQHHPGFTVTVDFPPTG